MTPVSTNSVTSQPSRSGGVQSAETVTDQLASCSPFAACFAVKNAADEIAIAAKNEWDESTDAEKAEAKAFFCTSLPTGVAVYLGGLATLPMTGLTLAGAVVTGIVSGLAVGASSGAIAKSSVEQKELALSKKQ